MPCKGGQWNRRMWQNIKYGREMKTHNFFNKYVAQSWWQLGNFGHASIWDRDVVKTWQRAVQINLLCQLFFTLFIDIGQFVINQGFFWKHRKTHCHLISKWVHRCRKGQLRYFYKWKTWFGRHLGLFLLEANFRAGEDLKGFEGIWWIDYLTQPWPGIRSQRPLHFYKDSRRLNCHNCPLPCQ